MSLLKYASKVSALTMLSRVIGFFEIQYLPCPSVQNQGLTYSCLLKIPNMMRRISLKGRLGSVYSMLAEYEEKTPKKRPS